MFKKIYDLYYIMKIISFNVNGLRAITKTNNLFNLIENEKPTILCLLETKLSCPIIDIQKIMNDKLPTYKYKYYSSCVDKNGYSGTAIFSKKKPLNVIEGIGIDELDKEGRVLTAEFKKFYLINVYTVNSGIGLSRLDYRINKWDIGFRKYLKKLQEHKPIIVCGDLNVANEEIDIKNPKSNRRTAGFTDEERTSFKKLLNELNLIDTYRYKNPDKIEYSYWTYRMNARNKNIGWRIDYFLVSEKIIKKVKKAKILTDIMGSDHAPVKLNITFKE
jgi:exodeoxyribonuclease-3